MKLFYISEEWDAEKWHKKEGIVSSIKDLKFCHDFLFLTYFLHRYLRTYLHMYLTSGVGGGKHPGIIPEEEYGLDTC